MAKRGKCLMCLLFFFCSAAFAERHEGDEVELVGMCVGRFQGLKDAFTLQGGSSMMVEDIRSYSFAELQAMVEKKNCPWELVPPWLDANDLRPLLRDYVAPAELKKAKPAISIPSGLFGEGQSKDFTA